MSNNKIIYKRQTDTFNNLLKIAQFTNKEQAAECLGISLRTLHRYVSANSAPKTIINHLLTIISGIAQRGSWQGFHIANDYLVTPYNYYISTSDLKSFNELMILSNVREGEIRRLKERINELEKANAESIADIGRKLLKVAALNVA